MQGRINVHSDYAEISLSDLIQIVANKLLELSNIAYVSEEKRILHQEQIEYVIDLLPTLQYGLDVNVKFGGVDQFEFTQELTAFDVFDIPLYHGWIVDPEDVETSRIMNTMSYNQALTKIVGVREGFKGSDNDVKILEGEEKKNDISSYKAGLVAEQFLNENPTQLTFAGLVALHNEVQEHQLAVFFRNNHFCTLFKQEGKLYLLATDLGFAFQPTVVWEKLDDVGGYVLEHVGLNRWLLSSFITPSPRHLFPQLKYNMQIYTF